jgi:hypothetical protein
MTVYSRSPIIWGEDYDILDPDKVKWKVILPYPQIMTLAEGKCADLAVLFELAWLHFEQKCNPVKYKGSRLSRYVRVRGLKLLEREKWISVEQERGKAPLVTLRWLKPTRASTAQKPVRVPQHPLHNLNGFLFYYFLYGDLRNPTRDPPNQWR